MTKSKKKHLCKSTQLSRQNAESVVWSRVEDRTKPHLRMQHVRARWNQGLKEDLDASLSPLNLEFTQSYRKQQESNN